jgi:Txe/YoeB family toxin of Txe-Axe toxin-antitoxin module
LPGEGPEARAACFAARLVYRVVEERGVDQRVEIAECRYNY